MAKKRLGFVTNSSSSSFLISKRNLSENQQRAIRKHRGMARKMKLWDERWDIPWEIRENDDFMTGYVSMDNFDMYTFMTKIGINPERASWSEYYQELPDNEDDYDEETDEEEWWEELLDD